jgi:hypothetical protein
MGHNILVRSLTRSDLEPLIERLRFKVGLRPFKQGPVAGALLRWLLETYTTEALACVLAAPTPVVGSQICTECHGHGRNEQGECAACGGAGRVPQPIT